MTPDGPPLAAGLSVIPRPILLSEDAGESYDSIVRSAAKAVDAELCHLALYDELAAELVSRRPQYGAPQFPRPQFRFRIESARASAQVLRTGTPYISNDPAQDPLYDPGIADHDVKSVLTVPVARAGATVGLLYALNRPGGFSDEHAQVLLLEAEAIAIALENVRLYTIERDRRIMHESLTALSRVLIRASDEDAALEAVLAELLRVVRAKSAAAVLVDGDLLRVAACRGGRAGTCIPLARSGDLGWRIGTRVSGMLAEPETVLAGIGLVEPHAFAFAAPLVAAGISLGAVVATFDSEPQPHEELLVSGLAEHTASFLDAGRSAGKERRVMNRAAAVGRVTWMVASRGDTQAIFELAASELRALAGIEGAVLYVHDAPTGILRSSAEAGLSTAERTEARGRPIDIALPALAPLFERRVPILLEGQQVPQVIPFGAAHAALLLPLISHDEVIGIVALVCNRAEHPFDAPLVDFLQDIAQQIAFGVENARLFSELTRMARTDELTGIANRRRFMEVAEADLEHSRQSGQPFALILADLDHLKRVNDGYGHAAGDLAIEHTAHTMERHLTAGQLAARIGGEEFAIALPLTDLAAAVDIAEQVRSDLSNAFVAGVGRITASFGVASCPADGQSTETLLKAADERLYRAKAAGRNRVGWRGVTAHQAELPYGEG